MIPAASIVHNLPGRARLRIASRVRDAAYFDAVAQGLLEIDAVESVKANPMAGSFLLLHRGDLEPIVVEAARRGWFEVSSGNAAPRQRFDQRIADGMERVHAHLRETGAPAQLQSPLVAGLVVAGAVQLLRGKWMPSGLTLAGYAAGLSWLARGSARIRPDSE